MRTSTKARLVGASMLVGLIAGIAPLTPSHATLACDVGRSTLEPVSGYSWGSKLQTARAGVARECRQAEAGTWEIKRVAVEVARAGVGR